MTPDPLAWPAQQAAACHAGRCKYTDRLADHPTTRDSLDCFGWHGELVSDDGEPPHLRLHRCPRFRTWIDATSERHARAAGTVTRGHAEPEKWK